MVSNLNVTLKNLRMFYYAEGTKQGHAVVAKSAKNRFPKALPEFKSVSSSKLKHNKPILKAIYYNQAFYFLPDQTLYISFQVKSEVLLMFPI